jgi:hypothetical protein
VPRGRAVQHIGLEHRVVADAAQLDAVVAQHVGVVFQVVAEFRALWILEQRPQPLEHHRASELIGCAGVRMSQRNVGGTARLDAHGHADDGRLHVVERGGLGVEAERFRLLQLLEPLLELLLAEYGLVVARSLRRRGGGRRHGYR